MEDIMKNERLLKKMQDKLLKKRQEHEVERECYLDLRNNSRKSPGEWTAQDKAQDACRELEREIKELEKQISELEK